MANLPPFELSRVAPDYPSRKSICFGGSRLSAKADQSNRAAIPMAVNRDTFATFVTKINNRFFPRQENRWQAWRLGHKHGKLSASPTV
jgi:hypothetical protein